MTDQTIRSFAQLLGALEDGQLHTDLTTALTDAVAGIQDALRDGAKPKAKLVLTLDLRVDKGVIEIDGDYKVTLPKAERGRSIFWATPENMLSRSNPRQADMFRDVNAPPAAARTVS